MTLSQASMRPIIAEEPECILLVEDEFLIRAVFAEEFRERGYRVIEAINADEALIMINASPPDLVITDIRMPGAIDGLGLLAIIRKEHPDLPVIVMSGHLDANDAVAVGAAAFLRKPFAWDAIADVAKSVLEGRR